MKLSIVIPCFNEERELPATLSALIKYIPSAYSYEIVIVDNGSTDRSIEIATSYNVKLIESKSNTVAGVRNEGVTHCNGDILVFLDADVEVTKAWESELGYALRSLKETDILGSHCSVPNSDKILFKYWYKAIEVNSSSHVGTGHMILYKTLFERLGGFNEGLTTGEDYDFCNRVKLKGGKVLENEKLVVYHNGYPETLVEFFKRELWHGVGDWQSVGAIWNSKVLILACVYTLSVTSALSIMAIAPLMSLFILVGIQSLLLFVAIRKFGVFDGYKGVFIRTVVFNAYFTARFLSFTAIFRVFRKGM
ncbi:glycosyltransferase [Saccharospirillum alexandrii]|uniref:glycosyltransferase n=1 Tax=Saccharospirillum alexandrii TaxID=2448477 RepID=UPI0037356F15